MLFVFGLTNYGYSQVHWYHNDDITQSVNYNGTNIIVHGTTTILDDGDPNTPMPVVNLNGCTVELMANARIIVADEASLNIDGGIIKAEGGDLYDGIQIIENSYLSMHDVEVQDAKCAVYVSGTPSFDIINSSFFKNVISLKVENLDFNNPSSFTGNQIAPTNNILYPGNQMDVYGIYLSEVVTSTSSLFEIGDNALAGNSLHSFPSKSIPVYAYKADLRIENTDINMDDANIGIQLKGAGSLPYITNFEMDNVSIDNPDPQKNSDYCITIEDYTNSYINNCIFKDAYNSNIKYLNNSGDALIRENYIYSKNTSEAGLNIVNTNVQNSFEVKGNIIWHYDRKGIIIDNTSQIIIDDNNHFISNEEGLGIETKNGANELSITDNTFDMNTNCVGIYTQLKSSGIDISGNTFNSPNTCKGVFIADKTSNTNVNGNFFYFDKSGPAVEISHSNEVNVNENTVEVAEGVALKVANNSEEITLTSNEITKELGVGIYASYTNGIYIIENIINFGSALNASKKGISLNNLSNYSGHNNVYHNTVNLSNYVAFSPAAFVGIDVVNSTLTDILSNDISNCGYALHFSENNANGKIGCNSFIDSEYGIYLNYAVFGESAAGSFEIGRNNLPYDNIWNNIQQTDGRVNGDIQAYNHRFYYKTGAATELLPNQYSVNPLPGIIFTSILTTAPIPSYCNGFNKSGSTITSLSTSGSGTVLSTANERDKYIGFAIDTNYLNNSSLSSLNPQNIYSNEQRYNIVKSAYYQYNNKAQYSNLGVSSDVIYNDFSNSVSQSNIGLIYEIDKAIEDDNLQLAKSFLKNYQPQSLGEINTLNVYQKYLQYLQSGILTSQDSSDLYNIAIQNPFNNGQSVYIARNLLNMYLTDTNYTTQSMQYMANTVGSSQIQNNSDLIKVYPNPANNSLYINLALNSKANSKLQIYSIEGKLIFDKNINSNSFNNIDISNIEKGIYFIKIINNGEILFKDKLIKL